MSIIAQTTPQEEAVLLLNEVISELTRIPRDIKAILRKCLLVCEILSWKSQGDWFHQELNGYNQITKLPAHREIRGRRMWQPLPNASNKIIWDSEELVYGADQAIYEQENDTLPVYADIDWFINACSTGYSEILADTKQIPSPTGRQLITFQRVRIFEASAFIDSVIQIERATFNFSSRALVQLKYGDILGDIWSQYRIIVDAGLANLNLADHFKAIQHSLRETNPEAWRSAILECRNLLNDLANHLWRDNRPRYEHLPGKSDDGFLDVTRGKFGNRLAAYLHQKGLSGTHGEYFRNEADRLATSILSLIAYQSIAHDPISLQDVRSIVIATYVLIGEIINRTDLNPVEIYGPPAVKCNSSAEEIGGI